MKIIKNFLIIWLLSLFFILAACTIASATGDDTNKMTPAQVAEFYTDEIRQECNTNLYVFGDVFTVWFCPDLGLYHFDGDNYSFEGVKKAVKKSIENQLKNSYEISRFNPKI